MQTFESEFHEPLLPSLSYQNSKTSSAIVDRMEVEINCVGPDTYDPQGGSRTIVFKISDSSSWLNLSTLRLHSAWRTTAVFPFGFSRRFLPLVSTVSNSRPQAN